MDGNDITRRAVLQGGAALAGLAALGAPLEALAAPVAADETVIPWLDQRPAPPPPPPDVADTQLVWEELGSQLTPSEKFFTVQHYGRKVIAAPGWRLDIGGLVNQPLALSLDEHPRPAAPGGRLHAGVLRQPRRAHRHRAGGQRHLGGHAARAAAAPGGLAGAGVGRGLLGRR